MHVCVWVLEAPSVGDKHLWGESFPPWHVCLGWSGATPSLPPGNGPGQGQSWDRPHLQALILADSLAKHYSWVFLFPSNPCFLKEESMPTPHPKLLLMSESSITCLLLKFLHAKSTGIFSPLTSFPSYFQPLLYSFSRALLLYLADISPLRPFPPTPLRWDLPHLSGIVSRFLHEF